MTPRLFNIILAAAALLFYTSYNCFRQQPSSTPQIQQDSTSTLTLAFTGDLMCHSPQFSTAWVEEDSFDFTPVYRFVTERLSASDFTFGNLETVTAGRKQRYSGYPDFNSPAGYLSALKLTGFDFLFTSNNHSLDRGEQGIIKTIQELRNRGISYTGTALSAEDRDSVRVIKKNGISIALLSYTYGTNYHRRPAGKSYLVNLIDSSLIIRDMNRAKQLEPDLILVYLHFGEEYKRVPSVSQEKIVSLVLSGGADIIIASHPHVLQKAELVEFSGNASAQGKLTKKFIAWSLGNFISNQRDRYTRAGVIMNLKIEKHFQNDSLFISDISYTPTAVYRGKNPKKNEYVIIPYDENFRPEKYPFLSWSEFSAISQSFSDTRAMYRNLRLQ